MPILTIAAVVEELRVTTLLSRPFGSDAEAALEKGRALNEPGQHR